MLNRSQVVMPSAGPALIGLLPALLLSSCYLLATTAGTLGTEEVLSPVGIRALAQVPDVPLGGEYEGDQVTASSTAAAIPPVCVVSAGSTTNQCHGSCLTCANTGLLRTRRACKCCKAGFYLKTKDAAACDKCPVGTYASSPGAVRCAKCASGQTTAGTGRKRCDGGSL